MPRRLILVSVLLLLLSVVALFLYRQPASDAAVATGISNNIARELAWLEEERGNIESSLRACDQSVTTRYPFFLYRGGELTCWTDNSVLPPAGLVGDSVAVRFVKVSRGSFLMVQYALGDSSHLVAMLPLLREYPVRNDYLSSTWNQRVFSTYEVQIVEPTTEGVPVMAGDRALFHVIIPGEFQRHPWAAWVCFALLIAALVATALAIYQTSLARLGFRSAIIITSVGVLAIRVFLLLIEFPRSWVALDMFAPQQFASSRLNPSLGDLALNVATVLAVVLLVFQLYRRERPSIVPKPGSQEITVAVAFACLIFTAFHFPVQTLQTIVHNSVIDLDVTSSLYVSVERVLAFSILLITWVAAFLLVHVLFDCIRCLSGKHLHRVLLAGALVFSAVNLWEDQRFVPTLAIAWITVWALHQFKLPDTIHRFQYRSFSYLFVMLFGFAINAGVGIYYLDREEKIFNQQRFAENYLADKDAFGEYLLSELSSGIVSDVYIQTRMASPFLSKASVEEKIRQVYLPTYLNKYDTRIYLFNASGNDTETVSDAFPKRISQYEKNAQKTEYPGLYKLRNAEQNASLQYVLINPIHRNGFLVGYVLVELSLKRTIPENVYPELLVDNRFRHSLQPASFSYATYARGQLQSMSGSFNYERNFDRTLLGIPELFTTGMENNGYLHVAVESGDEVVTVVSSREMPLHYLVAVMTFFLLLGLAMILLVVSWSGLLNLIRGGRLYYAARVQLLINLFFFIPLVVVSSITLRVLSRSSQDQLNAMYQNRVSLLAEQVQTRRNENTSEVLFNLSSITDSEIFLFDSTGHLASSSRASIFESQLKAPLAHPDAYQRMKSGEQSFLVSDEVGKLPFNVAYARIASSHQYLAIPYYQASTVLERIQIDALATILVIFVGVLQVLLFLSYLVSRWLTYPLELITRTLQQTSFEGSNKPLQWKANDEIGLMVQSYNEMLRNLIDSREELERMQRERTWREIAQQVAHEIKNPLTPMKLTLQRLIRAYKDDTWDRQQMEKSMHSVLDQVEILNGIATSFSSFAKLPAVQSQSFDCAPLIQQVVTLYREQPVTMEIPASMPAIGDPTILKTVFSNLMINAIQAKHPQRELSLFLKADLVNERWEISIRDNGRGISETEREKIFLPHFTTKETGSGLGLAIAKQSMEQMGGSIRFTSKAGQGATFTVSIPADVGPRV